MYALIAFLAALAQDADAVHDDVDALEQTVPGPSCSQPLEPRASRLAGTGGRGQFPESASRVACSYHHFVPAREQCQDGMAPDEARTAEHEDFHVFSPLVLTYFCCERNIIRTARDGKLEGF